MRFIVAICIFSITGILFAQEPTVANTKHDVQVSYIQGISMQYLMTSVETELRDAIVAGFSPSIRLTLQQFYLETGINSYILNEGYFLPQSQSELGLISIPISVGGQGALNDYLTLFGTLSYSVPLGDFGKFPLGENPSVSIPYRSTLGVNSHVFSGALGIISLMDPFISTTAFTVSYEFLNSQGYENGLLNLGASAKILFAMNSQNGINVEVAPNLAVPLGNNPRTTFRFSNRITISLITALNDKGNAVETGFVQTSEAGLVDYSYFSQSTIPLVQ